jgi:CHAT domain-containing protein/tetratricopeptide (TPR) repeat protein
MLLRILALAGLLVVTTIFAAPRLMASPQTVSNASAAGVPANRATVELTELDATAQSHYDHGDYAGAQRLWESYLLKSEEELGPEQPSIARALIGLASCQAALGKFDKALPLLQRALAIQESTLGKEHPAVGATLRALGSGHNVQGNHEEALGFFKRSLSIVEKTFGPDDPRVVQDLLSLAAAHRQLGAYTQALALLQRAQAISEAQYALDDETAPRIEKRLASAYLDQGDSLRAFELLQRKLAAREKGLKPESPALLDSLDNLAAIYTLSGACQDALPLLRRSLSIKEKVPTENPLELADSMEALANCCSKLGADSEAVELFQREFAMREAVHGKESVGVVGSLRHLAELHQSQGRYEEALTVHKRCLAILESAVGPEHRDVAYSLGLLAQVCLAQTNYDQAVALSQRALDMMERLFGQAHPDLVQFLGNSAAIYIAQGDYERALPLCERALSINERCFGTNDERVVRSLNVLALVYLEYGDFGQSINYFSEMFRARRANFAGSFLGVSDGGERLMVSDKSALTIISDAFFLTELYHSICAQHDKMGFPDARCRGAEQLAFNKALFEEIKAAQWAMEGDPRSWTKDLRERAQAVISQLSLLGESGAGLPQREKTRGDLQSELAKLKTAMGERIAFVGQTIAGRNLKLADIAHGLPAQSALVDFVQYHRYEFLGRVNHPKEPRYAVYVTFAAPEDSTNILVERVDLGEAGWIDGAVELVSKRMSAGQYLANDLPLALQKVSELVYGPLAKHLKNVSHLIICPDGQLSRMPFEMLSHQGRFLIEDKTINYVTSGREVVRLQSRAAVSLASDSSSAGTNKAGQARSLTHVGPALVMGGPNFDLDLSNAPSHRSGSAEQIAAQGSGIDQRLLTSSHTAPTRALSRDYRGIKFQPLPGAEAEARSVAGLLGSDCVLRVGAEAREADLKAVVSPRVLHLATHGFFLSDQEFKHTNGLTSDSFLFSGLARQRNPGEDWENPLMRCGIALAGANHASQITNALAEDGLLTGLEASLLNLQGTELVILSACDSGRGEVKIGEGVMSLRRAFRIAGAQTVLASHWKVSDEATRRLMTEFIRRWRSGEPRAKAWREAQLSLLHSRDFSNPYFWAAFTLTGQWK